VGVGGPAAVEHVGDAEPLLFADHGEQSFRPRGGNGGDLRGRAAGRDQSVPEGEVVAAHAVPDRARVAAGDVRLAARERLHAVLAGAAEHGADVVVVLGDAAGSQVEVAAVG